MDSKTLTIKEVSNGYTVSLSYCTKKGGLEGYHSEEFIIKELPAEINKMFEGKFDGRLNTPKDREMSFNHAEDEAMKEKKGD